MSSSKIGLEVVLERRRTKAQKGTRKIKKVRKLKASIKQLRAEMAEISRDQNCIIEKQRETRGKFQEIESECFQLKKESKFISQLSEDTQLRLGFMSKILKAREDKDLAKAYDFPRSLLELIAKQNKQK